MPKKAQINMTTTVAVTDPLGDSLDGAAERIFSEDRVFLLHLSNIVPSPFEPQARRRAKFKTAELEFLGDSIINQGLFSPIVVRFIRTLNQLPVYEIVFGERRYLAAKLKNLSTIKCFIRELTDSQVLENQYQENHQRGDNDPLDDAFLFQYLKTHENYTDEKLAARFSKPKREITEKLKLNDLIEEARQELADGSLPLRHAYYLAKFSAPAQTEIVNRQYAYKYHDRTEAATSYHEFKSEVEAEIVRNLIGAPFSTVDPRLHVRGLLCPDCPDNSAHNTHLFPEMADAPRCLNKPCFEIKTNTHLRLARHAIAERLPNPTNVPTAEIERTVPLVTTRKYTHDERTPFKEKVLTDQTLLEKKECEFSELSLVVEGEKKGQQVYVCRNDACPVHRPKPVEPPISDIEAEKNEAEYERRVRAAVREKVLRRAMESFDDYKPIWMFDDLVQRVITELWTHATLAAQQIFLSVIKEWKNAPKLFYGRGDVIAFVASCDKRQQSQLIFLLISAGETDELRVAQIAHDYAKVDYLLLDAEARLELAPDEFKEAAAEYVEQVKNGEPSEPPRFWRGED